MIGRIVHEIRSTLPVEVQYCNRLQRRSRRPAAGRPRSSSIEGHRRRAARLPLLLPRLGLGADEQPGRGRRGRASAVDILDAAQALRDNNVLGQTVESFLDSGDGGRDGAFTGNWKQTR